MKAEATICKRSTQQEPLLFPSAPLVMTFLCFFCFLLLAPVAAAEQSPLGTTRSLALTHSLSQGDTLTSALQLFAHDGHGGNALLVQRRFDQPVLSYKEIGVSFSYDLVDSVMLRVGSGVLIDQQSSHLAPGSARFGIDFASPWLFSNDTIRPVFSSEVKMHQEYRWSSDISLRAGFRFKPARATTTNWSVMAEYFTGHQAQGQFYKQEVNYIGIALHCQF